MSNFKLWTLKIAKMSLKIDYSILRRSLNLSLLRIGFPYISYLYFQPMFMKFCVELYITEF